MTVVRLARARGRHAWGFDFLYEGRRYQRTVGPTKTLARLAEAAEKRRLMEGRVARIWGVRTAAAPGGPTLAGYLDRTYLPDHVARLAPSTQKTERSMLGKLGRQLGRYRLDELGPEVIDGYARRRLAQVSGAMVREEVARLSRVLNDALRRGVLTAHPFRGRWRRPRARPRDYRELTPAEERRLLRAAGAFAPWIVLAVDTGLRKGELRMLEARHVALARAELRLEQPKTGAVKVVPLTPRAVSTLRALRGSPYLLGGWSLPWVDRQWSRVRRAAGLAGSGLRFNDLRHTFASRALRLPGADVPTVGELLGHRPPYTTTLRYVHPLASQKRAVIKALGESLGAPRMLAARGRRQPTRSAR